MQRQEGSRPVTERPQHQSRDAADPAHFVLKRGHHGRFRFTLRTPLGGIGGEVFVRGEDGTREEQEREALRRIGQLARDLLAEIEQLDGGG